MAHPNENPRRYQRIKRGNDGWYFGTREGISVGPFPSYLETLTTADDLARRLADQAPWKSRKVVEKLIRERCHAGDRKRSEEPRSTRTPAWIPLFALRTE